VAGEREAAAATPPGVVPGAAAPATGAAAAAEADAATVRAAVERFIDQHGDGDGPDPAQFAASFPEPLRPAILAQCRQFLAFDGLLGHQPWQEPPPATANGGRRFGEFDIHEELGRGGMGIVYLATQRSLNRRVALKVMQSGLTLSKRHVERFRREAAAAAQLRHPAIVAVHALAEVDGTFALAMDYVAGRNLADLLDDLRLLRGDEGAPIEGSLGIAKDKGYVAECAMFGAQLASALATAHQANVVHRDLKPRNLMLDDRRQVRLLDFGLAKSLGEGSISMSGEITGTAHYMSPEQTLAKRVEVDHRSDLWALGVILYEMLTLRRPFDGKNLQQIVYEICFKEPPPIQRLNAKVPRDLVTIVQKALEKDPQKRYQSASDVEADLQRFLRWEPIHAKPATALSRCGKFLRRHRTGTALAAVVLLAGIIGLGFVFWRGVEADRLLAVAEQQSAAGQHGEAEALASQALALRNDATTRALWQAYSSRSKQIVAESLARAYESKGLIESDRERALATALEAESLHSSLDTRSAVLEALGRGSSVRPLRGDRAERRQLTRLRWSPDGSTVGVAGYRGLLELRPRDGGAATALVGHGEQGPVIDFAFVGDDRLVSVGVDRTLRCWLRQGGKLLATLPLPGAPAPVGASADRKRLLVACGGKPQPVVAQVFDTTTLQPVGEALQLAGLPVALALSPNGAFAAISTGIGNGVWLWPVDAAANAQQHESGGRVRALTFTPDGALLAVASDAVVRLLRCRDGALLGEARHSDFVQSLAFDARGERLLSGSSDRTARLWRLEPNAERVALFEVATLLDHHGPVDQVEFAPDGQLALTGTAGARGELLVFDVGVGSESRGSLLQRFEVGPSINSANWSPDGASVLAQASESRALVWDLGSDRGVVTIRLPGYAWALRFDANGERLATAWADEQVRVWSALDGKLAWQSKKLGQPQTSLDVDARGERLASGSRFAGLVHVLRLADGEPLYQLRGHGKGVHAVRFCAHGGNLLTAGLGDGTGGLAVLWNANDWSASARLVRPQPIVAADVTGDGTLLATVEEKESIVRLWSLPDGAAAGAFGQDGPRPTQLQWAPDSQALLVVDSDGRCRLVDRAGTLLRAFTGERPIRCASFASDGGMVSTGGDGSSPEVLLFRTADASAQLRFGGHRGKLLDGTFSTRGDLCATSAQDGTVCIWPTDPVAAARRRIPPERHAGK
jgi:WD40 repeat protein